MSPQPDAYKAALEQARAALREVEAERERVEGRIHHEEQQIKKLTRVIRALSEQLGESITEKFGVA